MARLLFLVSSARSMVTADRASVRIGYFPSEALIPYERFTCAGIDVLVTTPDGEPPYPDPYGLETKFHYHDVDEDFMAAVVRSFGRNAEDIRVTLDQLTEYDLIAARRIFDALRTAGASDRDARRCVEVAAKKVWRERRNFVEALAEDSSVTAWLTVKTLRRLARQLQEDSVAEAAAVTERLASIPAFQHPVALADLIDREVARFDGVFIPGGYGPMVDLAGNPEVGRIVRILHQDQRIIAAFCHGPAALLSAGGKADGSWLFDGYRLTCLTDEEEAQSRMGRRGMAWSLEAALRNAGAVFDDAPFPWVSHVVADRNLITAQNPMSTKAAADFVLKRVASLAKSDEAPTDSWYDFVPGRQPTSPDVATDNLLDVARGFFEHLDGHDVDGALALVDPEAEVAFLPLGVRGVAGLQGRAVLDALCSAFPDLRVTVRALFVGADGTAVAEITVEGTQATDFFGIDNQEKHLDVQQAWLLEIADGQVRGMRAYWCQNQLYRRLAVKRIDDVEKTGWEHGGFAT